MDKVVDLQQQRLRLALALFGTGGLLVLDEPTQFLDDHWAAQGNPGIGEGKQDCQ